MNAQISYGLLGPVQGMVGSFDLLVGMTLVININSDLQATANTVVFVSILESALRSFLYKWNFDI